MYSLQKYIMYWNLYMYHTLEIIEDIGKFQVFKYVKNIKNRVL